MFKIVRVVSDSKENIVESKWYMAVLKFFAVQYSTPIEENGENNDNNIMNSEFPEHNNISVEGAETENNACSIQHDERNASTHKNRHTIRKKEEIYEKTTISNSDDCTVVDLEDTN